MEKNNMILSDQKVSKEYQIPELVDLNSVGEAMGAVCSNGSSDLFGCSNGSSF
jgi:hypothetical protein